MINVQLKKVTMFDGHDGTGFTAELYINSIKCMHVLDLANGGQLDIKQNIVNNPKAGIVLQNIALLNEHISQLPDTEFDTEDGKVMLKMDLELFIEDLINVHIKTKNDLQTLKLEADHVLYGTSIDANHFSIDMGKPLVEFDADVLQSFLDMNKSKNFKPDFKYLNKNLVELGYSL